MLVDLFQTEYMYGLLTDYKEWLGVEPLSMGDKYSHNPSLFPQRPGRWIHEYQGTFDVKSTVKCCSWRFVDRMFPLFGRCLQLLCKRERERES